MKKLVVMFALLLVLTGAQALLSLELTSGMRSAVPIAVVPFSGETNLPEAQRVAAVIHQDLNNSGEFMVRKTNELPAQPHNVNDINVSDWRSLGLEYVLVGSVQAQGDGNYQVVASLVRVYQATSDDHVPADGVLFSKVYEVKQDQLRTLSHHISDWAYQTMTGTRGVFSTKIAYVLVGGLHNKARYQLVVADYDGFNPQVVVKSDEPLMSPAWSDDNSQIAFVSFKKVLPAIYTVNLKTGKIKQLTKLAGINGAPAWSPSGETLAFVSSKTGQAKLYLLNLKSHKTTQLTTGPAIDTEPNFSPDGRYLLFTSSRSGGPQIYQYTLANKRIERLTYQGDYNARASYSDDGKYIVLLHRQDKQYGIAIQALSTDRLRVLTRVGLDESPSFSPNAKMVIYATNINGQAQLALVSANGEVQLQLPESAGQAQEPAWSDFMSW